MTGLFWPGDTRADGLFDEAALVRSILAVEAVWLAELVEAKIADDAAVTDLADLVGEDDLPDLRAAAEDGGNAVQPVVALLRERLGRDTPAATWLHRGLTSQDVLDTALLRCAADVNQRLRAELRVTLTALAALARRHRDTPMVARTLTQHALPFTFGVKVATWLNGVADAVDDLDALRLPAQFGGAVGTHAALTELLAGRGAADPAADALAFSDRAAERLGLIPALPWHTARAPMTRLGAAWVATASACGRIANDVLVASRPEVGELGEPGGRGGSSTMPQKANPVLSVLIRRAAAAAPGLGAQLQLASALTVDERADGAWHLEWPALQLLARHAVAAASQTAELVSGLRVDTERMSANLDAAGSAVRAEQQTLARLAGAPAHERYDGASQMLITAACERARRLAR